MLRFMVTSFLIVILTGVTWATPQQTKTQLAVISAVTTANAGTSGEVNGVTSDDRFVRVQMSPSTSISQGKTKLSPSELKIGHKITCKGNWDTNSDGVFNAVYVFVGNSVSDFDVRDRVAAACHNIVDKGKPMSGNSTLKTQAHALSPQLELTKWLYGQSRQSGSYMEISGAVKNITDRPMTELRVTVDFYTSNGSYITSSDVNGDIHSDVQPWYALHPGLDHYWERHPRRDVLSAGESTMFIIRTEWLPNEYPEVPSKCILRFSCTNQGNLRTNPLESKLKAEPLK